MSTCHQKHGAIIMRGGSVLSVGINSYRNEPEMFDIVEGSHVSWHAEVAAIKAYRGSLIGASIYVARINKNGEQVMSKPCEKCQEVIKRAGIKKIFYTINNFIEV